MSTLKAKNLAISKADELHELQLKISRLKLKLKELEAESKELEAVVIKAGKTFVYNGADGFQKVVKINHVRRRILDQAAVVAKLKSRTPYTTSNWTQVKVDWVYE